MVATQRGSRSWDGLYPFAPRGADVGGLRMHYVDEGTGPPVVLVHGNPTWSFLWRRLILDLRRDHRVIAPDHIGMGWSDKPGADRYPFTLARRIADFGAFLDGLNLTEPITLVVHDWGTAIGMGWAIAHPDSIARIVVTNGAAFPLPREARVPVALRAVRTGPIGAAAVLGANAFVRGAVRWAVKRPMEPAVADGYLAPYDSPAHRLAILEFVRDIPLGPQHRSHSTLMSIEAGLSRLGDVPMLVCWGGEDFVFTGAFLAEWQRRFPDADVQRLTGAGHLVLEDAPDRVVSLIRAFVT